MIGLDFGTTNSCAAFDDIYGGVARVSARPVNSKPYDTIISSTVLDPCGRQPAIGRPAQEKYRLMSTRTARNHVYLHAFKPHLDDERLRQKIYTKVGESSRYDQLQEFERSTAVYDWVEVGGKFSRDEVVRAVGEILSHLVVAAEDAGAASDPIYLGLPVTFSARARKRLICALRETQKFGDYADVVRRVRFVPEPLAAAAAAVYDNFDFGDAETVLVFDHGGGTLDLSLVEFKRIPGFEQPMPIRELASLGSDGVAGRAIDHEFARELRATNRELAVSFDALREWDALEAIEDAKRRLSKSEEVDLYLGADIYPVDRQTLYRALRPVLAEILRLIERVCERAQVAPTDVDRVLMTGGSSLIPGVQDELDAAFPHLDEYRFRRYDAMDDEDVEAAVTEVAQGLVRFGLDDTLKRVTPWHVELATSEHPDFELLVPRGTPFEDDRNGRPHLRVRKKIADANRDGMSFGLYERQLELSFLFGLADVPPQEKDVTLEVELRPDEVFPRLRLLGERGAIVKRDSSPTGWPADTQVKADLMSLPPEQLEEFFESDIEYLPDTPTKNFRHAPLARRLRRDDRVEVTKEEGGKLRQYTGTIFRIRRLGEHVELEEMDTWDVDDFEFLLRADDGGYRTVQTQYGYVRLAPKLRGRR